MSNNILTEGNGFTTSYLPNQDSSILSWEDASQTETALLIKGEPMRILNGDWRELYAKCDGPKAAIKLYEAKKTEHASSYTEV
ncbi:MAG: hypothetical protein JKY50_00285 [Oleispira sp.]|nr:hypothetical protein [Oleispira sp.]